MRYRAISAISNFLSYEHLVCCSKNTLQHVLQALITADVFTVLQVLIIAGVFAVLQVLRTAGVFAVLQVLITAHVYTVSHVLITVGDLTVLQVERLITAGVCTVL